VNQTESQAGVQKQIDPLRHWGIAALALLVLAASVLLPHQAQAASLPQEYTYAECSRADESAMQDEMTALAHGVLVEGSSGLDINALVAQKWRETNADVTFNAAVDAGIARVQAEKGYWERFWSGWSADKAEELAGQVAAYAFEDASLKAKLDELSTAIAVSLVAELESAAARSASSALLCLQEYVGEQYSATLFTAFQQTVSQELATDLDLTEAETTEISPLEMHAKGLTGVGVIVATQITRRVAIALAKKITGRLAGKIAGRVLGRLGSSVVPYIGWAVGVGLLVWDLVEGSQGALPTIREALQAEEVKQEVRVEIAAAVREGLDAEVETLASTMAGTLVGQWQDFCADHGAVCELAAENTTFRALLDSMPVASLDRLVQLVDFYLVELDAAQLNTALDDGTLAKLITAPPLADTILGETGSPATTLAWVEIAGEQLPRVVELRLCETIDPLVLTSLSLASLLAIEDNVIIHKVRALPVDQLLILLELPSEDLRQVATITTADELSWLAGYLAALPTEETAALAHALASGTTTIAALQAPPVVSAPVVEGADVPSVDAEPRGEVPNAAVALWSAWTNNGVAVAAALVVLLLVIVGMALALRREIANPPV
jgi:hypothetical protein